MHSEFVRSSEPVKIISFSGIDGAGKTTQIDALTDWLSRAGLRVDLLTFWDNVVVLSRFREGMSLRAFKGDKGIGSPERPLHRRDKNVTSWPVTAMRFFLYLGDALSLCWKVRQARKGAANVVIFDRYIYDELANLPLNSRLTRVFVRLLLKLVPKPDVAYVVDADPVAAVSRKPEYPLEFVRSNRQAYLALSRLAGNITVIEPLGVADTGVRIREVFLRQLSAPEQSFSGWAALQAK